MPAILDQDGLHGPSTTHPDSSTNDSEDMKSVLSLDDGRWSVQAEERTPLPPVSLEEELSQLIIKQPSPPPVLAEVQRPISPSRVADLTPGIPTSEIGRFHDLHFVSSKCTFPFCKHGIIPDLQLYINHTLLTSAFHL